MLQDRARSPDRERETIARSRIARLLTAICGAAVISWPEFAAAEQPQQVSDEVQPPHVIEIASGVPIFVPVNPKKNPPRIETHRRRILEWSDNWLNWAATTLDLSESQVVGAAKVLDGARQREEIVWNRQDDPAGHLLDTTVILFAGQGGTTARIMPPGQHRSRPAREFRKLLTPDQFDRYREVTSQRLDRQSDLIALRSTAVLDNRLLLTAEQREATRQFIRNRPGIRACSNGLFGFHGERGWLSYERPLALVGENGLDQWNEHQRNYWQTICKAGILPDDSEIRFRLDLSTSQRHEQCKQWAAQIRSSLQNAALLRSEYASSTLKLTPPQRRRLHLAAKGSAIHITRRWSQKLKTKILDAPDDEDITMPLPHESEIDRDMLWVNALEAAKYSVARELQIELGGSSDARRDGILAFVLLTLDRELLLSETQLEEMRDVLKSGIVVDAKTDSWPVDELCCVARCVVKADPAIVKELLNDHQHTVWKSIVAQFPRDGNVIRIPIRTGHILIPVEE